jgi:formate hydrogenlyase subunit 3/multisubunit Na+/H+ antiporter MnhD subunit
MNDYIKVAGFMLGIIFLIAGTILFIKRRRRINLLFKAVGILFIIAFLSMGAFDYIRGFLEDFHADFKAGLKGK